MTSTPIHGLVTPGFEPVRHAFERNFTQRGELGAACCVYHRGAKVVDLWGGFRDQQGRQPWDEDSLVCVFSTTKGIAALTLMVAHARGWLDFEAPVARYWPEFAQQGKENITVRQLLSHQAGLCALDTILSPPVLADLEELARILARQKPAWKPGEHHGYHGITLGWFEGELLRRIDPQHRSLGTFFAEEIARPLGLEFYIGLPHHIPEERLVELRDFHPVQMLFHLNTLPLGLVLGVLNPWSLTARSLRNPRLRRPGELGGPTLRHLELPAGNGIGRVSSIARLYGQVAVGGQELGLQESTLQALYEPARQPTRGGFDLVLRIPTCLTLGFMKPFPGFPFSPNPRAFGTPGFGGSFGFADPDAQIGYAYAPNRLGFYILDDPRDRALREAVYGCLG